MSADEREARIRALLPLVKRLARRVMRVVPGQDIDDLVGDGSIGLIRAVDGYDATRGIPLEAYARTVILGAILNGVRRLDPVSERVRRTVRRAEEVRFTHAHATGRIPGDVDLERAVPGYARARTEAHRGTPLSLDAPLPLGERECIDIIDDPQRIIEARAHRAWIADAVAALPPRQRRIVALHYYGEQPLRKATGVLGVSHQRVSQLHLAALRKLRRTLTATA